MTSMIQEWVLGRRNECFLATLGGALGLIASSCAKPQCGEGATQPLAVSTQVSASGPALASTTEGAFVTGKYRNVFAELGKPEAEIEQKITHAFDTYFSTSDPNRLFYEFAPDMAYVKDIAHDDIRSEGQSYAMMIALQRNDRAKFDKLWKFAFQKMRVATPTHPSYRGYAWVVDPEGKMCDENSAPDGEEYLAMALYFAHNRWGSAQGEAFDNYKHWADDLLDMMKSRPSITGMRARRVDAGSDDGKPCTGRSNPEAVTSVPLFDATHKIIRFNASTGNDFTDPSYHVPAFYDLFANFGPAADADFWRAAASTSRLFLGRAMNAKTGLAPEYANYDGSPHPVSWNQNSAQFAYDAWRVGGNVGFDVAWMAPSGSDEAARADALVGFFHAQDPGSYKALWKLDGTGGSGSHSTGLVAMNAVATLATTKALDAQSKAILEDFWSTPLPTGTYRYYDGLLYLFGMLHLSGHYNIYKPAG